MRQVRQPGQRGDIGDRGCVNGELGQARESAQRANVGDPVPAEVMFRQGS